MQNSYLLSASPTFRVTEAIGASHTAQATTFLLDMFAICPKLLNIESEYDVLRSPGGVVFSEKR
jgi:hypothetical protein